MHVFQCLLQTTLKVPWLNIAKCVPLYALAAAHFTCNIGYYTLLTCLPQYFKYILNFDIKSVSSSVHVFLAHCLSVLLVAKIPNFREI